jgi:hypothetical protein
VDADKITTPVEPRREREARVGWYRFKLDEKQHEGKQALYLWRFSMNAAVWLNDEFLGDGGRFEEPIARNWNRPFLFLLPNSAWNEKDNYLYIKLAVYFGWGHLSPIINGPNADLRQQKLLTAGCPKSRHRSSELGGTDSKETVLSGASRRWNLIQDTHLPHVNSTRRFGRASFSKIRT